MNFVKYNERKFLDSQIPLVEDMIKNGKAAITADWQEAKTTLCDELLRHLIIAKKKYDSLQHAFQLEDTAYVQLSFLRTAIILHTPWYRIDLYGQDWQASEIECCTMYSPTFLTSKLREAEDVLTTNFKKQSAAGMYFLEEMVLQIAEEFHLCFSSLLPSVFALMQERNAQIFPQSVNVYCGEFLDDSQKLFYGRI